MHASSSEDAGMRGVRGTTRVSYGNSARPGSVGITNNKEGTKVTKNATTSNFCFEDLSEKGKGTATSPRSKWTSKVPSRTH